MAGHGGDRLRRGAVGAALCALALAPGDDAALTISETDHLVAPVPAASMNFGRSIDASDDLLVVGAPRDPFFAPLAGSAFVFVRQGGHWAFDARLAPFDLQPGDEFGYAVAVDGNTIIVGAHRDDNLGTDSGSAYVFVNEGGGWRQQAHLVAADGAAGDAFGRGVAIDGDTALVGAPRDSTFAGPNAGSFYVFERNGEHWSQQAKVFEPAGFTNHRFGHSVAISGDTAVAAGKQGGSPTYSPPAPAWVFVRDGDGWSMQAMLPFVGMPVGGLSSALTGTNVAIEDDVVVMGIPESSVTGHPLIGTVRIFERTGATWDQVQDLFGRDATDDNLFGSGVAIDGDTIVVGAAKSDVALNDGGAAYLFRRQGPEWIAAALLLPSDLAPFDRIGNDVAVSGTSALVAAPLHDDALNNAGAVFAFTID